MRVLVTGGAGFIGSHLAQRYIALGHDVIVLDDLSSGREENVPEGAQLAVCDVADTFAVERELVGTELVFHEAAARAVLRSVEDPLGTERANSLGTLNILVAARDAGVRRVVVASSSSVYGGVAPVPTSETASLHPKSPYAVSKLAAEGYARVFAELYDIETVALRYFNVFGPRQRPDDPYSAVIPLFVTALSKGERAELHGDGLQSRDFTYIDDVVQANELAASADPAVVSGHVYNVGCGQTHNLLELVASISRILRVEPQVCQVEARPGDVRISQADITAAIHDLGYRPTVSFEEGLLRTVASLLS